MPNILYNILTISFYSIITYIFAIRYLTCLDVNQHGDHHLYQLRHSPHPWWMVQRKLTLSFGHGHRLCKHINLLRCKTKFLWMATSICYSLVYRLNQNFVCRVNYGRLAIGGSTRFLISCLWRSYETAWFLQIHLHTNGLDLKETSLKWKLGTKIIFS